MPQFRKKPVVIDAWQWQRIGDYVGRPDWFWEAISANQIQVRKKRLRIRTLEGDIFASPGDWIIRGIKGEVYPCKPDIFSATYEPV